MGFKFANPNPYHILEEDCVIRAIALAENKDWDDIFIGVTIEAFMMKGTTASNRVWRRYLRRLGYTRHQIPNTCPDCYTVADFAIDHPIGTYILGTGTHAVAVINGNHYDTWDSGNEVPMFYWERR